MSKITPNLLLKKYMEDRKSMRKIASELNVGKTTIEYYFKKYNIKRRTKSDANKIRFLREPNWIKGLNKKNHARVEYLSKKIKETYKKKTETRIKHIEEKFGKKIKELLEHLYIDEKMSQEQISKEIQYGRKAVIDLMKKFNIPKRPKYQYISSLKGSERPMLGKTWDGLFGIDVANKRRKEHSLRFRALTIKRLKNNEFPFLDTKIEKKMAKELIKKKIPFIKQFNFDNKFVCDMAIPHLKMIIECDGDYWHANPSIYRDRKLTYNQKKNTQRDKFKDRFLTEKGWLVLRFFESDIKKNMEKCTNLIEETIKRRRSEFERKEVK